MIKRELGVGQKREREQSLLSSQFFDDLIVELLRHREMGCEHCYVEFADGMPNFKCFGCNRMVRDAILYHAYRGCKECQRLSSLFPQFTFGYKPYGWVDH